MHDSKSAVYGLGTFLSPKLIPKKVIKNYAYDNFIFSRAFWFKKIIKSLNTSISFEIKKAHQQNMRAFGAWGLTPCYIFSGWNILRSVSKSILNKKSWKRVKQFTN